MNDEKNLIKFLQVKHYVFLYLKFEAYLFTRREIEAYLGINSSIQILRELFLFKNNVN
jgi:hypothetical protein